jgi:hypothetical protein
VVSLYTYYFANDPRFNTDPGTFIDFLCQLASRVREYSRRSIPVSTGFCRFSSIPNFHSTLDQHLDFYDFHHYNHLYVSDTAFLPVPRWGSLNIDKPCIIGECGLGGLYQRDFRHMPFGEAFRAGRSTITHRTVFLDHLFQAQRECIWNIMNGALNQGYAGCLVWEYGKQYTNRSNPYCPYNARSLFDLPRWEDRLFLLWTPNRSRPIPPEYTVELRPADPDGLVGRPVVQRMCDFAGVLTQSGSRPPQRT